MGGWSVPYTFIYIHLNISDGTLYGILMFLYDSHYSHSHALVVDFLCERKGPKEIMEMVRVRQIMENV